MNLFTLVLSLSFLFFSPNIDAADRCSDIFRLGRSSRDNEVQEIKTGLLRIVRGLPSSLRNAIEKSLLDQRLSIEVMTREVATKLDFPQESVGIFISKNENRSEIKDLVRSLRNHFNILEGSRNAIIVVRDSGRYSKIQEELALFHELAHFVFYQKIKSSSNPRKSLADFMGHSAPLVDRKQSLDFVDEMMAHSLEVLVAFEMSRSYGVDVLKFITGKDYRDMDHALIDLPNRIQREYGLVPKDSFSAKEILELLQTTFIFYSQEI